MEMRKYSSRVTPTSHYWGPYSRIEDYELKERVTLRFTGKIKVQSEAVQLYFVPVQAFVRP